MQLIANKEYRLLLKTNSDAEDRHAVEVTLIYCGGSQVDGAGHHVAGGIWARGEHPNYQYYRGLRIIGISEVRS